MSANASTVADEDGDYPDGGTTWMLFPDPTPGSNNNLPGYESGATAKAPEFSPARGSYSDIITVSVTSESPASTITYTLDGLVPDISSTDYQGPIQLKAKPAPGFEFVGWAGIYPSGDNIISVNPEKGMSLQAVFQPHSEFASSVVINEINYNDPADFDTEDWVELHNSTERPIDVSGWVLRDSNDTHEYSLPENTSVGSLGYLVVCRDTDAFRRHFPEVSNYIGEFDFGQSSEGDQVRLYDNDMSLVDSVAYGVDAPWLAEPNGQGPALALANRHWDNTLPESWVASDDHGSPGARNGESTVPIQQDPARSFQRSLLLPARSREIHKKS